MTASETIPASFLALLSRRWPYIVVSVAFTASQVFYRLVFDIRFDTTPVRVFIQYIDPWFVEHDFLRSLLYLHQQPPLQNLLTGGCVRIFGASLGFRVLHAAYLVFGLATALAMLHAMLRLGVVRAIAVASAALYTMSPATVAYENWLFYHAPVAALQLLSLVALLRHYRFGTFGSGLACFGLLATSALFYGLFGPLLLVLLALALILRPPRMIDGQRSPRTRVLLAMAIPLCVLLLDKARTRFFVGHNQGDAFLWMNLAAKTYNAMRPGERQLVVQRGEIIRFPRLMLFSVPLSEYDDLRIPHEPTGVPLLDLESTPDGSVNAHALEKVLIAETFYREDALYLLQHYPRAYLRSVFDALTREYFYSPLDYDQIIPSPNRDKLKAFTAMADVPFLPDVRGVQRVLVFLLPLTFVYGLYRVLGGRGALESGRSTVAAISFMLLVIAYVTFATAAVSSGDFNRYRYNIDPFYVILFSLLATDCAERGVHALRGAMARLRPKPMDG